MLSHLRFHRRGPSNPTSPAPDQSSPSSLNSHQQSPLNPDSASPLDAHLSSSASNSLPPTLPPITRVTSSELNLEPLGEKRDVEKQPQIIEKQPQTVSRPPQPQRSGYSTGSGFIGGVALRNYQRNVEAQQVDGHAQASHPTPMSNNADLSRPLPQTSGSSKGNLPYSSSSNQRLSGSRLAGESLSSSNVLNIEPQKGKKGLPFLKNPMSTLLLRRRNNQNLPNASPLPLDSRLDEPTYDPRIKGTRVHDFSAPRRRTNAPANDTVAIRSASLANIALESGVGPHDGAETRGPVVLDGQLQRRMMSSASDPARPESGSTNSHTIAQSSSVSSVRTGSSTAEQAFPLDDHVVTGLTMKGNDPALQKTPSTISQATTQEIGDAVRNTGSIRTTRSRNVSLSSIPRHMKSTSSRFSFDMIGAAKQEKLLEERHRQRELDKKAAAQDEPRDSRFDDFDEDAFDYDAMMDDDGLEEKIPGINADYDDEEEPYLDDQYYGQEAQYIEDEIDPDDDQENFAGFSFQRSNPTSSLATPQSGGMMPTPRDADGEVIGSAMTKDTPGLSNLALSPEPGSAPDQEADAEVSGLGIHRVDAVSASFQTLGLEAGAAPVPIGMPPPAGTKRGVKDDDLYFDEGMASFGGVFAEDLAGSPVDDGVPFDESIFDNDDTDQYGRPLPGAFAQAKSAREKGNQESPKEETEKPEGEVASQQSSEQLEDAQSAIDASTSISTEHPSEDVVAEIPSDLPPLSETTIVAPQPTAYGANPIAAYQAALAAAAQKAAEAGQFERAAAQSPTDADNNGQAPTSFEDSDALRDYEYDDYGYSYDDMDDFEMDDDAIIAEANASALANDSDGWYGQEFGFYAAPVNNHGSGSNMEGGGYVAGGFFGPKGASNLNRSISGRVVSREPNLTPITERSEYSNRNSLMSLGMPPISGTPIVQSPGLAQLAMMADRGDDQMNLTALLRLRSKAWGGSQASLASSKDGSPRSERGDGPSSPRGPSFPSGFPPSTAHTRKNSVFSIVSRDSDGSVPASPTLTMPTSALAHSSSIGPEFINRDVDMASAWGAISTSPIQMGSNIFQEGISPLSDPHHPSAFTVPNAHPHAMCSGQDASSPERGHQRQKGSTDSISYIMEEESGEKRWVMERRRTGEFGEVEILEREVVEGGRI
ncbi:uncharacterized protein Triagg1_9585 [Trichoderma aggressivum f. europaeum]|uniref:AGC-kinase C-terminal domain-containing protein n=1 Tax=Trichoderma aggressivum f. europaeum TaxID=173218 RepID=A0AAE1M0K5_9HYPO|nr:hypothetical protein Triagg1_9585 [Trichoderma aggressivum f. europaeum]